MGAHFSPAPPAAIVRLLSRFDRDQLAGFITVAIDLLDLAEPDTDSDEGDTEDAFAFSPGAQAHADAYGAGCPASDPGDISATEWHTRRRGKHRQDPGVFGPHGNVHEDDELAGDETDGVGAEDEPCGWFEGRHNGYAGGCPISDPGGCEHDGREPTECFA
jgi:hypothetical protein